MVKRYEEEFKKIVVKFYDSGQAVYSLSVEYSISEVTLYRWSDRFSKKAGQDYSKADFLALKKEISRVQEECDLLKKVLTIFAEKKKWVILRCWIWSKSIN